MVVIEDGKDVTVNVTRAVNLEKVKAATR